MALKLLLMKKVGLLLLLMKNNILKITKNILSYNNFVNCSESNCSNFDNWLNMEILNALALDEWENDDFPVEWDVWKKKYQKKAIELVEKFLLDENNSAHLTTKCNKS